MAITSCHSGLEILHNKASYDHRQAIFQKFEKKMGGVGDDVDGFLAKAKRLETFMTPPWSLPQDNSLVEKVYELAIQLIYTAQKSVAEQQLDETFSDDLAKHSICKTNYEDAYTIFKNSDVETSSIQYYFPISHDDKARVISKVILCGKILNNGNYHKARCVFDLVEGEELVWLYPYRHLPSRKEWVKRLKFHCELNQCQTLNIVRISLINLKHLGALFLEKCNSNLANFFCWGKQIISTELKRDMILQIGEAIIDIHQRGHVLWDFKPENILFKIVSDRILIKLADLDDNELVSAGRFDIRYHSLDAFSSFPHPEPFKVNSWQFGLILLGFMDIDVIKSIFLPKKSMIKAYDKYREICKQAKEYHEANKLFKTTSEYKKCEEYLQSKLEKLKISDNPMVQVVLKLMNLDFIERLTIQEALDELKELWSHNFNGNPLENRSLSFPPDRKADKEEEKGDCLVPSRSQPLLPEIPRLFEINGQSNSKGDGDEPIYTNHLSGDPIDPLKSLSEIYI